MGQECLGYFFFHHTSSSWACRKSVPVGFLLPATTPPCFLWVDVGSLVFLERPREAELFTTVPTLVRPGTRVDVRMVLQVGGVLEAFVANGAGERSLPGVNALVPLHVALLGEGLSALLALERLLAGVDAHVAPQPLRAGEALATQGAGHFLFGLLVSALVLLEIEHVDEGLATQGAEVLPLARVVAHVPLEHGQVDEALATLRAVMGPLLRVVTLVHPQLEGCGEGLLAVGARVMVHRGVAGLVNLQVRPLCEALPTDSALVWLLPRVH